MSDRPAWSSPAVSERALAMVQGLTEPIDILQVAGPILIADELRRITTDGVGWAIAGHLNALANMYDPGNAQSEDRELIVAQRILDKLGFGATHRAVRHNGELAVERK